MDFSGILDNLNQPNKHPKCKGYFDHTAVSYEWDCEYDTILECEECKYGMGRKDPEAKCNQTRGN